MQVLIIFIEIAKDTMKSVGVPVIPGSDGVVLSASEGLEIANMKTHRSHIRGNRILRVRGERIWPRNKKKILPQPPMKKKIRFNSSDFVGFFFHIRMCKIN